MSRLALPALASVLVFSATPTAAADPGNTLELRVTAEVEVEVVNAAGEPELARVEAATVVPGDQVIYTISCANHGTEAAENVLITNPIPEHMRYVPRTAETEGAAVLFSVDGGNTYGAPEDLVVDDGHGGPRRALAADYTHIRWSIAKPLAPDEITRVAFRAILE